jgi:hypothetical protein
MSETPNQAIRIDSAIRQTLPRAHITQRLRQALSRAAAKPVTARASFSDVNGPKGGLDIRCVVSIALPGQPVIAVTRRGRTPRLAFDDAYARACRSVDRARARWEASRRRPRKYYAAKRLLSAPAAD